jgi:hypothetical protein
LVIEAKDRPGGQPQFLYADKRIVDIPGFPDGVTGEELSDRTYRQAVDALVQFRFHEELTGINETDEIENEDQLKEVVTNRGSYLCRKVIIHCLTGKSCNATARLCKLDFYRPRTRLNGRTKNVPNERGAANVSTDPTNGRADTRRSPAGYIVTGSARLGSGRALPGRGF